MPEPIMALVRQGRLAFKYLLKDYWLDIGLMKNYEQARKDVQRGIINCDK